MNVIVFWLLKPFSLLDSTKARLKLVIFCGVFGCLFLNVFHPFNINLWFVGVKAPMFIILTFFSAAGMAALALSQFAVRALLKVKHITRIGFLGWFILEFFLISVAIHTVNIILLQLPFINLPEYLETLKYTLMVLVLPYFLAILLLYLEEQHQVVEELTIKVNRSVTTETVTIVDENGKVAVNMPLRNILYFKSEDNYILLYYKGDQENRKELIRTNLKRLEQDLSLPNFIRIHRSYMINSHNLKAAVKTSKGYMVKMEGGNDTMLPVSATYQSSFEDKVIQKAS